LRHSTRVKSFEEYRTQFHDVYAHVKREHLASPNRHQGHGFDHDVAVAQMAARIAPSERLADMGWVSGLMHSTDRLIEADQYQSSIDKLLTLIPPNLFTPQEINDIYLAVLEHDQKTPAHRSPVQEVLQDADKLVNMQATVIMRAGQFRPDLPVLEYQHLSTKNPMSTYQDPQNILDNLKIMYSENPDLLFTEKGRELGAVYADRLAAYAQQVTDDCSMLGLTGMDL